jgi:hypothetical protein
MRYVTVRVAGYTFRIHATGKVVSKSPHAQRWRQMVAVRVVGRKPNHKVHKSRHLKAV